MKKLSELEAGEAGIIHSFEKDELYIKLLEMILYKAHLFQMSE